MGVPEVAPLLSAIPVSILVTLAQAPQLSPPAAGEGRAGAGAVAATESLELKETPAARGPLRRAVAWPRGAQPVAGAQGGPAALDVDGFSGASEGGEIFLQTTREVAHDMAVTSGPGGRPTLSVFLRNCRIHWKNNARRIDTSFFATPVDGIVARQKRRDVELSIRLKESVVPIVRWTPGPDGSHLLVLSFPAGQPGGRSAGAGWRSGCSGPAGGHRRPVITFPGA